MVKLETVLSLKREEAIVLMEFLSRFENNKSLSIQSHSEEIVLWRLQGELEKALVEPFSPKWDEILKAARQQVEDEE